METPNKEWVFAALYVSSGNIPGAKLFHTEEDFDNMPEEIHNCGYGGWACGSPWGTMQVETAVEAIERLKKLVDANNNDKYREAIDDMCFDWRDFVLSDPASLATCEVWWTRGADGDTPFVACLKNPTEVCELDDWFHNAESEAHDDETGTYNVFRDEDLSGGDMEGGTSELYTAAQIIEDAGIQEELMS
jgi:hypothetical protein